MWVVGKTFLYCDFVGKFLVVGVDYFFVSWGWVWDKKIKSGKVFI